MRNPDGPAKGVAEDVLAKLGLHGSKVGVGIEGVIAEVVPDAAVKDIGTRLGLHNDLAGASEAVSSTVVVFEDAKLIDGVDDGQDIDVCKVAGVHVVDAVERVDGILDGGAVDNERGATRKAASGLLVVAGSAANTRNELAHRLKVTAIEHQVLDLLGGDRTAGAGVLRLYSERVRGDVDRIACVADLERNAGLSRLARINQDVLHDGLAEAVAYDFDVVGPRRKRID